MTRFGYNCIVFGPIEKIMLLCSKLIKINPNFLKKAFEINQNTQNDHFHFLSLNEPFVVNLTCEWVGFFLILTKFHKL